MREGAQATSATSSLVAVKEVGGPSFFSLLVIAVSFMPVFALEAQEGRLFKPLAFTKTFSMAIAAVLAITLDPALRLLFTRMRPLQLQAALARRASPTRSSSAPSTARRRHPISRPLMRLYHPVVELVLRYRWLSLAVAVLIVAVDHPGLLQRLGSEFMPPLNEGTILYMPMALPGHVDHRRPEPHAADCRTAHQDSSRRSTRVFGKTGRAETLDRSGAAQMFETSVAAQARGGVAHPRWKWAPLGQAPPPRVDRTTWTS